MSEPSAQDYLDIAGWMYNSGTVAGAPAPGYRPFMFPHAQYESQHHYDAYAPSDGFYAAAYVKGRGADRSVVIGFEGTNLNGSTQYAIGSAATDVQLYFGQLPTALREALDFATSVIRTAVRRGISRDHLYVDGHSLGAAEAEYVASQTGLHGTTFGTPGVSSEYASAGRGNGLTNYVDYGDPVGNYAYQPTPSVERNFVYSDKINHVGHTNYVGDPANAGPLTAAGLAFGQGNGAGAIGSFLDAARLYHPLSHYAADLGLSAAHLPQTPSSFDSPLVSKFLSLASGGGAHATG